MNELETTGVKMETISMPQNTPQSTIIAAANLAGCKVKEQKGKLYMVSPACYKMRIILRPTTKPKLKLVSSSE